MYQSHQIQLMARSSFPRSPPSSAVPPSRAITLRDRWNLSFSAPIECLVWSPSGRHLALMLLDGHGAILDGRHGQIVTSWDIAPTASSREHRLTWSPSGEWLAVGDAEGAVRFISPCASEPVLRHQLLGAPITHLAWSPKGNSLALATGEGIFLYQPGPDLEISPIGSEGVCLVPLAAPVRGLFWLPGPSRLVAAGDDGLSIVNPRAPDATRRLEGPLSDSAPSTLLHAAPSPDGRMVATSLADGRILLWSLETGDARLLTGLRGPARQLAWGASGTLLAAVDDDRGIAIWTFFEGRLAEERPRRLLGHRGPGLVRTIGFHGAYLFSAGDDGVLRCWRQHPNVWRCTRSEHVGWPVEDLAVAPSGRSVAVRGQGGRVWNWHR